MARQSDRNSAAIELSRGHIVGAPGEPPFELPFRDMPPEYQAGPEPIGGLQFGRVGAFLLLAGWFAIYPTPSLDPALPIFILPDKLAPHRGTYAMTTIELAQPDGRDLYFETDGRVRLAGQNPTGSFELGGIFFANTIVPLFH